MMTRLILIFAAVLALAACTTTAATHPHAASTPHPQAPAARFMTAVQAAGLGDKDTASPAVLTAGHAACKIMPAGLGPHTYQRLVQITVARASASTYQARVLVDAAIRDLCPWAKQFLPAGAP